jgi:cell division transport system permease protein
MITLAAKAALAANGQVIRVLRLIGARDITIATAFVRRFTRAPRWGRRAAPRWGCWRSGRCPRSIRRAAF